MTSIQPIESSTSLVEERNTAKTVIIGILTAAFVIAAPIIIGSAGGNYWV
ncbi:ABC transporter ATP-binding protein, partial [Burkholderia cepacia]